MLAFAKKLPADVDFWIPRDSLPALSRGHGDGEGGGEGGFFLTADDWGGATYKPDSPPYAPYVYDFKNIRSRAMGEFQNPPNARAKGGIL